MMVLFQEYRRTIWIGLATFTVIAGGAALAFSHTLASADAIARKEAKECGIERISVSEIPQEIFHASRIFEASGLIKGTSLPSACTIAVTTDKHAYTLPESFNYVIEKESYHVDSQDVAVILARFYVSTTHPYGKVLILKSSTDIPYSSTNAADASGSNSVHRNPQDFAHVVSPLTVSHSGAGFKIQFYLWRQLRGSLEQWSIVVSRSGTVSATSTVLSYLVGNGLLLL